MKLFVSIDDKAQLTVSNLPVSLVLVCDDDLTGILQLIIRTISNAVITYQLRKCRQTKVSFANIDIIWNKIECTLNGIS